MNPSRYIMMTWLAVAWLGAAELAGQVSAEHYRIEDVPMPAQIAAEVSAITFTDDGRLYVGFRRGYIWWMDLATKKWTPFASGLQTPMGMLPGKPGEFFVAHMPELTRVVDTDGDGRADLFETICDQWGMSGNYHEFVSGPVRDADGNFYLAIHSSSNGGNGIMPRLPVRGTLTERGHNRDVYQMYSPTPYRGWVVRVSPDGTMTPWASGFRQPNGITMTAEGDVFVTGNQGEWVGTSTLYHIKSGHFYGHPASLVWDPSFDGDPIKTPIEKLQALRTMPAIQFPQEDLSGSSAQPLVDTTEGKFGPYSGQMLVADWTYERIYRATFQKVGGEYQGACFAMIDGNGLKTSNHRMAFAPDGSLYVAQTARGWGSGEGLQRIVWTGKVPMDILDMKLTKTGFELTFTKPVDRETARDPAAYSLIHYYYKYHAEYGSPKTDVTPVQVTGVLVSDDARTVTLTLPELVPWRVYELRPRRIRSADGEALVTELAAYTLNRLLEVGDR